MSQFPLDVFNFRFKLYDLFGVWILFQQRVRFADPGVVPLAEYRKVLTGVTRVDSVWMVVHSSIQRALVFVNFVQLVVVVEELIFELPQLLSVVT